jgi:hypothetical protein
MAFLVILIVIAIVIFFGIGVYNGLVKSRNGFKNAFAQIDVQLTRRNDLIPNLVETAKGYLKHERETLEARRYGPVVRGDGVLSRSQGQREHDAAVGGTHLH